MSLSALTDWIWSAALPAWRRNGRNTETSLFYEKLRLDGSPDDQSLLRTRTQFRQLYVWSHASVFRRENADRLLTEACQSAHALRQSLWARDGRPGWARAMTQTGDVADPTLDLYDHACVLLGLCWLAKASGDGLYLTWIDETLAVLDTQLAASGGGFSEDDKGTLPRRQNPHMHLFESFLALAETTGEQRFLDRADELFSLFTRHFHDPATGSLREYFGPEWEATAEWQSDQRLEPGHHCEWVWLLRRYARLRPEVNVDVPCAALLKRALSIGQIASHGLLALEVDDQGRPRQQIQRLWAQAEYLKALIVQGDRSGAADLAAVIKAVHLDPAPDGTWIDCFTLTGAPAANDIPASSLYHLFTSVPEILRLERDQPVSVR